MREGREISSKYMNLAWLPCFHAFSISSPSTHPHYHCPFILFSLLLSLPPSLSPSLMAMQASLLLTNIPFSISGRLSSKTTILPSSSPSHGKHLSNRASALKDHCEAKETHLYSITPLPLLFVAALPGAGAVRSVFGPFAELVKSWNLPDWLIHWGHPGNMAVVLFAMGGYGTYLGFRIRFSDDIEEKAKAKDLHPKLLGGMFFFFALGATGGITSLLTSDKPIFEREIQDFVMFMGSWEVESWPSSFSMLHLAFNSPLATDILLPPRILRDAWKMRR